jgi:hypothetical protein
MKPLSHILDNFNVRGMDDEPSATATIYKIPKHQRFFTWSISLQQKLVKSVFNGFPIPCIILVRHEHESFTIEDGQQRITSLKLFYEDKFECDIYDTGENKKFSELSADDKFVFKTYMIGCDTYSGNQITPSQIIQIFILLNQGKPLTDNDKYYARMDTAPFLIGFKKIINIPNFQEDIRLFMTDIGKGKTRTGLSDMIGAFLAIKYNKIACLTNAYYINGMQLEHLITKKDEEKIIKFITQYFDMLHTVLDDIDQKPLKCYGKLSTHLGLACYSFLQDETIDESLYWYVKKTYKPTNRDYEPKTFLKLKKGDRRNCQGDSIQKRFDAIKEQYILDKDDENSDENSECDVDDSDDE